MSTFPETRHDEIIEVGERGAVSVAKAGSAPTADAQGEQGNPPLPPSDCALVWLAPGGWSAILGDGRLCLLFPDGEWIAEGVEERDEDEADIRRRLAAEVIAQRARVEELTALVKSAWREGISKYLKATENQYERDWLDSATSKALTTTTTGQGDGLRR